MHRKHLLPGFDDRTADEAAIEALTQEITSVKKMRAYRKGFAL